MAMTKYTSLQYEDGKKTWVVFTPHTPITASLIIERTHVNYVLSLRHFLGGSRDSNPSSILGDGYSCSSTLQPYDTISHVTRSAM